MQNTLVIWLWLLAGSLFSQVPQRISYQGVARSSSGTVLSNTTIAVRFQIHQSSPSGLVVFTEDHQGSNALSTNAFGLFTTAIGRITSLGTINWENGPFFIEVSIDPANGTSYSSVGTQELMSVPYALYAAKAGNATPVPTIAINAPNTVSNPSAGTYSITIPAAQSYTAGSGIDITGGIISTTLSVPSPTISGVGQATVTSPSSNTYLVEVPTPTLSISGNSLSISPGNTQVLPSATLTPGNSYLSISGSANDYTLTPITPTLNVTGGSLAGAYPSQTLTIPSSSTTLVQGNNISLTQSGSTYTLSSVTPTLNVSGGSLTGAYPSQTLTIPSSSTTLVQGNNISLTQSGNTYTLSSVSPTLTAGSNVTVTPIGAANAYTISAGLNNYSGTTGNISIAGNTVNLIATGITAGTYGASAGNLVPVFTVDNFGRLTSAGQYTPGLLGDVTGTINATTVGRLRGIPVSTTAPVAGDVLGYNGSSWTPSAQSVGWKLTGNAGTTASNFLGTTDNRALVLKTDDEERAKFSTDNQLTLFSDDNSNPGKLNFNGNFSNTIRVLEITTGNNGSALSVIAGDARSGTGNSTGGNLNLSAGAATGSGSSVIDFLTAGGGTTGSARVNPLIRMRLNESGQLLLGPTSGFSPNSKLVIEDGHIESKQTNSPAIAGAGSLLGLSGSSATLSTNATDVAGTIFIYTGLLGGGGKGNYATITFDKAYANAPVVILTPRTEDSAGLRAYVTGTTGSGFTLAFSTGTAGLTTYEFNYMVLEVN